MIDRVCVDGKHLARDGQPFRVRGATYGSFRSRSDGRLFPEDARIWTDLSAMVDTGLNTVRTYTVPPRSLLEMAEVLGLAVLVGLHYEDWRYHLEPGTSTRRAVRDAGRRAVDDALAVVAGSPALLAVSVGNEVPVDVARVHGVGHVEDVLSELVERAHGAGDVLATYSNFPTTEFIRVHGQDLTCFNVFLESPHQLRPYLRHLQVVAGATPLLITELGLSSTIHSQEAQAASLSWQLDLVDECGLAGATVFAWTDEWAVNDQPVEGWDFGITTVDRQPKPALAVVGRWANRELADLRAQWPRVSVIVCAYNEERTIEECLTSLAKSPYPDLEVVVCDDGSTDHTLELVGDFPFQVLALDHGGLSRARNAGLAASTGGIVAYLDADAACHPEWPFHLALSLEDDGVVATGGPNLPYGEVGLAERCVAASPGGPVEVLLADDRAEHVPGCNMAFRREALESIGGFDPVYTSAGDDVDVCWKLLDRGGEIAFAPAAQVRHHRRASIRGYLRQQRGYGRAEAMLTPRHRHRFNRLGQARWQGVIYGGARVLPSLIRPVVYHGYMAGAPFQPMTRDRSAAAGAWGAALVPLFAVLAAGGALLIPLAPPVGVAVFVISSTSVGGFGFGVAAAVRPLRTEPDPLRFRAVVGLLHILQPVVRAWGRLRASRVEDVPADVPDWCGDRLGWLRSLEAELRRARCAVRPGGTEERWDLLATIGPFLQAGITTGVVWEWQPVARVSARPRRALWLALAVVAVVGTRSTAAGVFTAAATTAALHMEYLVLRSRVRGAIARSTARSLAEVPA